MEQEMTATSELNCEPLQKSLGGLLEEAHQALACFNLETARSLFSAAAQQFPDNDKALFELGYFLYEQNEHEQAAALLRRAIELAPLKNAKKYFTLAQLSTHNAALAQELYLKGIEIANAKNVTLTGPECAEKVADTRRMIAQGYCGLAHLEVTKAALGPGLPNPQAFLDHIKHAIESDPLYLEAYSQLAVYYFNVNEEALCRNALAELTAKVQELDDKEDDDLADYGPEFFLPIARIMVELELWDEGATVTEVALQNDKTDLEVNYLFAFCLFKAGEFVQSAEACRELENLRIGESGDEELIEGFLELKDEVQRAIAVIGPVAEPQLKELPDSDNDWIDDN